HECVLPSQYDQGRKARCADGEHRSRTAYKSGDLAEFEQSGGRQRSGHGDARRWKHAREEYGPNVPCSVVSNPNVDGDVPGNDRYDNCDRNTLTTDPAT